MAASLSLLKSYCVGCDPARGERASSHISDLRQLSNSRSAGKRWRTGGLGGRVLEVTGLCLTCMAAR